MDEYYASRKRLRASYPSPDDQGSSSSNGFSYPGLPTPESQCDPALSPAMSPARAGSTQSISFNDSTPANNAPSNGKRKATEVVDLTGESGATAPMAKPFKVGDVIDLTEDSEAPASFSNAPVNRSARDLSYRATKIQQCPSPYPYQYSAGQSPYQLYSHPSSESSSRSYANTQRYANPQQYSQPYQYAHTPQGQFPQPTSYPGFSVPPGFEAAYGRLSTGTSDGKDRIDLTPGAQLNLAMFTTVSTRVKVSVADTTSLQPTPLTLEIRSIRIFIQEQSHRPIRRREHKSKRGLRTVHLTHTPLELCCNPGLGGHGKCPALVAAISC
jgi:hypothetical protein